MQSTVDEILAALARRGGRRTTARRLIVEEMLSSDDHFTADELAGRVRLRSANVNVSTVYRALDALEEAGVIDHVHLGHGRAVFHRLNQDHQHLVCDRCEQVQELPASKLRGFAAALERDFGFVVDRRHFAIVGRCRSCRDASALPDERG